MSHRAARVNDKHHCPEHQGLAILPLGAATVLIGNHNAARLGDRCACDVTKQSNGMDNPQPAANAEPTTAITEGAPKVLIENAPAARMGDSTRHGGFVLEGAPTVLIGDSGAFLDAKIQRLQMRQDLIAAARAKAATMTDPLAKAQLIATASALERLNTDVEMARLAAWSYDHEQFTIDARKIDPDFGMPTGWERLEGSYAKDPTTKLGGLGLDDPDAPLDPTLFRDDSCGFNAVLYRSKIDGTIVLAFTGTQDGSPTDFDGKTDWSQNRAQAVGLPSPQHEKAVALARAVQKKYGNFRITGDSLGGGLATLAGLDTGMPTTTTNAAGVSHDTIHRYVPDNPRVTSGPTINPGGVLGAVIPDVPPIFTLVPLAIATAVAKKFLGPVVQVKADIKDASNINAYHVDGEVLTHLQEEAWATGFLPDALGNRFTLPAVDPVDSSFNSSGFVARPDPGPVPGLDPERNYLHGYDRAIAGMEAEKQALMTTLRAAVAT